MSDLQRGIQLVQQAVQHDANNDIPEAIRYYSMALELFAAALQGEYDDARRQLIQDKMAEYSNRLRILQDVQSQARGARASTLPPPATRAAAPYEKQPSHSGAPPARPSPYGSELSNSDGSAPTRPLPRPGSQVFGGDPSMGPPSAGMPPGGGGAPPPVNRTSKPPMYESGLPPQGSGGVASPPFDRQLSGSGGPDNAYLSMQPPGGGGGGGGRGAPPPYGMDGGGHAPMMQPPGGGRGAPPPYGMDDGGGRPDSAYLSMQPPGGGGGGGRGAPPPYGMDGGGHAPMMQPPGGGRGAPSPYGMDDGGGRPDSAYLSMQPPGGGRGAPPPYGMDGGGHAPMMQPPGGGRGAPPPYGMDDGAPMMMQPPGGFGDPHMSFQGQPPSDFGGRPLGRSNTVSADIERSIQQGRSASMTQLPPRALSPSQTPHMSMVGAGPSSSSQPSLFAPGGGAPDDGQAPIKPSPIHPMLIQFATEFPKEQKNLQAALNIAEVAKQEDKLKHYQAALDLYTDVLERFMLILQSETNPGIRTSLRETMTAYITRAEQIKDVCKITPHRVADFVPPSSISAARRRSSLFEGGTAPPPGAVVINGPPTQLGRSASMMDAGAPGVMVIGPSAGPSVHPRAGADARDPTRRPASVYEMGPPLTNQGDVLLPWGTDQEPFDPNPPIARPVQVSNETKSLLGRQKLILAVSVKSNVVLPNERLTIYIKVDNRSTMVVDSIKVSMRRIERMQKFDSKGKNIMTNDVVKVDKQEYFQGGIFPLPAESNYTGEIVYHIPADLRPTNLFQRGVFEREYDLTVQCQISMRNNLKVRFPVVVDRLR